MPRESFKATVYPEDIYEALSSASGDPKMDAGDEKRYCEEVLFWLRTAAENPYYTKSFSVLYSLLERFTENWQGTHRRKEEDDLINRQDVLELARRGVLVSNRNFKKVVSAIEAIPPADTMSQEEKMSEPRERDLLSLIIDNLLVAEHPVTVIKYLLHLGFDEEDIVNLNFERKEVRTANEELSRDGYDGECLSPIFP